MPWDYTNVLITLNIYFKFYKNIQVWILQKLFNLCPGITQMFWLHWICISSFIKNIQVWILQLRSSYASASLKINCTFKIQPMACTCFIGEVKPN